MEQLLTVKEVGQTLRVSQGAVFKLIRIGTISTVKIGKSLRFKPSEDLKIHTAVHTVMAKLLTAEEVMAIMKISKMTLWRLMRSRVIKYLKIGRHLRFRESAVEKYLDSVEL